MVLTTYMIPAAYGLDTSIQWTKEELEFINSHPVIKLGVDPKFYHLNL